MEILCHCGNIGIEVDPPNQVTVCNCSICSRYQALWGYYKPEQVSIETGDAEEDYYIWGDKELEFVRCAECGCVTHYRVVAGLPDSKIAVNFRLAPFDAISSIPVRYFNGKDSL